MFPGVTFVLRPIATKYEVKRMCETSYDVQVDVDRVNYGKPVPTQATSLMHVGTKESCRAGDVLCMPCSTKIIRSE